MLGKAIAITSTAFVGVKDKGGKDYILHCLRVMNGVIHLGENYAQVAVMHDLIEDTAYTIKDLYDIGFCHEVVEGVEAMTHLQSESYQDYIMKISKNEIARACKLSDLRDNSDITRLKGLRQKDLDRLSKYQHAYEYLTTGKGY